MTILWERTDHTCSHKSRDVTTGMLEDSQEGAKVRKETGRLSTLAPSAILLLTTNCRLRPEHPFAGVYASTVRCRSSRSRPGWSCCTCSLRPKGSGRGKSTLRCYVLFYIRSGIASMLMEHAPFQAVKSLGKTLKTFQPTIREVMSVSSELRNTLEEQIGLDDIRSELQSSMISESRPSARRPAESVSTMLLLRSQNGNRPVCLRSSNLSRLRFCCRRKPCLHKTGSEMM